MFIMGARIKVSGRPPQPPFLLVANHVSYLDILTLASQVKTVFVSKADVGNWPLVGFLARIGGTLFINRRNKKDVLRINSLIESIFDLGGGIVFFPEGTTSMGDTVHRFKASLLDLPARRNLPVSFASITYRTPTGHPPAHTALCWWGDATFADHLLGVLNLPWYDIQVRFGDEQVQRNERKELAQLLENQVRATFQPITTSVTKDRPIPVDS